MDLFGFRVEIDEVATKEWYDKADEWGCECGDCRHFVALAKKRELPSVVTEILDKFGISPEKLPMFVRLLQRSRMRCISLVIVWWGMS